MPVSEEAMMAAADLALVEQLRQQNKQLSLQIGEQNTTIGYQDAMLARFEAELSKLRDRQFAAFTLIGRLDYFLETYASQPATAHKKLAAQLRREIAALTTTKEAR